MITCQKCGKENQDHYKFCLGCGAELSAAAAAVHPPGAGALAAGATGSPARTSADAVGNRAAPVETTGNAAPSMTAQPGPNHAPNHAPEPRAVDATHASPGVQPATVEDSASSVSVVSLSTGVVSEDPVLKSPVASSAGASLDSVNVQTDGAAPNAQALSPSNGMPAAQGMTQDPASQTSSSDAASLGPTSQEERTLAAASPVVSAAFMAESPDGSSAPAQPGADFTCPQCSRTNAEGNRFCASCGYKLNMSSLPARPVGAAAASSVGSGDVSLTALRADGTEAGSFTLPSGPSQTVGRDTGSIFSGDSYLSPRHATFVRKGDRLLVSDAGSLNGVYYKISPNAPWTLRYGDVFRIGQEILRLERLEGPSASPDGVRRLGSPSDGYVARLGLVIGRDTTGNAFPVPKAGLHLGRERGDVLFPEDGYVSGLHCRLAVAEDGTITLTDLGSSNGSFVRLKDEHPVAAGDILLMGQQLFRVDA